MRHLSSITSTFFVNLLNRLGVRPPPPDGFDLINTVQPVTLVDSDIVLSVNSSSSLLDLPFTAGPSLNPAAAAVLADTGPQVSGSYQVNVFLGTDAQAASVWNFEIVRRNAANSADVWVVMGAVSSPGGNNYTWTGRINLLTNERLIVRNKITLAATGLSVSAVVWISVG